MQNFQTNHRLEEHERLVHFMDNMAILLGCIQTLHGQLPDATRPDVIRLNTKNSFLFIGDAKNSESPNSNFTQQRLLNYLVWLSSFLTGENNRKAIFAICSNKDCDSSEWVRVIKKLFVIADVIPARFGTENFDIDTNIVWFEAFPRVV